MKMLYQFSEYLCVFVNFHIFIYYLILSEFHKAILLVIFLDSRFNYALIKLCMFHLLILTSLVTDYAISLVFGMFVNLYRIDLQILFSLFVSGVTVWLHNKYLAVFHFLYVVMN